MAQRVEDAMARRGRLLVEAGTGVGKSFAYLIPAIARAVAAHERVVVSTNTISLQEQLMEKDLPLLRAASSQEFSAVLAKGRSNYVSLRRLRLASERQDRLFVDEEERHHLHAVEDWAATTRDGTLASLPVLPPDSVWEQAQSDTHNCMGKRCPSFDKCFYQSARRRMENADILVCNHALFFSDLAMRASGRGFLPDYQHAILDEAHEIETVACSIFYARSSRPAAAATCRSCGRRTRASSWSARRCGRRSCASTPPRRSSWISGRSRRRAPRIPRPPGCSARWRRAPSRNP
jgi:ATP-dependent DNA helicase DinG